MIGEIRQNLNMDKFDIGNSNTPSVVAAVASRIVMGTVCDSFGPRLGHCITLLLTAPAVCCMPLVNSVGAYIATRFFIGLALACFVPCQYWSTAMFSSNVVGLANGVTAGWGNSGAGFTHLIMPQIMHSFEKRGFETFEAWRWSFYAPAALFIGAACLTLVLGEDSPDGDYRLLKAKQQMKKVDMKKVFWYAVLNYRTWALTIAYMFSFGVELVMDNIASQYYQDTFGLDTHKAGQVAASFGLMAVGIRPLGGYISDRCAERWGMRGR
jgi:MFS transporter, NNP family, nitrate/nitrite transporter